MDAARHQTIIQALQQKTVANGCTPHEARSAAARVILLRLRYGRMEPPPHPSEAEYAAFSAQFGSTPWQYTPKRTWIDNVGQGLRIITFVTVALLVIGMLAAMYH